jgi:LPXTG-motif cell wall-anchored protein
MKKYLLDVKADPGFFERNSSAKWLIIAAIAALAGLVVWFVLRRRNQKKP